MDEFEIFCPKCQWKPSPSDRWSCLPECGIAWNTFWTRGLCPGCGKQWEYTQCLSCGRFSLHEHWYHYKQKSGKPKRKADKIEVTSS